MIHSIISLQDSTRVYIKQANFLYTKLIATQEANGKINFCPCGSCHRVRNI